MRAALEWQGDVGRVDLGAFGAFSITADGIGVVRRCDDHDRWREVLLGPAAMMWLAERKIFALHASAFVAGSGACAVLGVSGAGKSTIARHAAAHGTRIADDVLPIAAHDHRICARPPFPQLKLSEHEQYSGGSLPLARIALLTRGQSLQLAPASPREVGRWILQHTLGSRLYSPRAMVAHLQMAATVATAVERGDLQATALTSPHCPDPALAAAEVYAALA